MKNAYDLARELITVLADIDSTLDKKSKTKNVSEQTRLDKEIDNLEIKMLEIKNQLKKIEVK
jgi:hypothetical protein